MNRGHGVLATGVAAATLEIEKLLLLTTGLMRVRELLKRRGASAGELEARRAGVGRPRCRLDRLVRVSRQARPVREV